MTILATVIVLGVLIFVHELGHFMAAKLVGVEVQRFSIGLGPRVWGFKGGETEYVISAVPLGGYVKMGGMDDEIMEKIEGGPPPKPRVPGPRDFDGKPLWARTFVISAGVIMNMFFAFFVYTLVAGLWGVTDSATTRVGQVLEPLLPPGSEALAAIPTVAFENPAGQLRIDVPEDDDDRRRLASALRAWLDPVFGSLEPASPAEKGGIEVGDRIVSVDGVDVQGWWGFQEEIRARPGARVELVLIRDGRELTRVVNLDSREEVAPETGEQVVVGKIGAYPAMEDLTYTRVGLAGAVSVGYRQTLGVTGMILGFLRDLITGNVSPRSVGSIVTIGEFSGQAAAQGLDFFLSFMALFSVNLAILNLLPIPVLDGGHLLFLTIEAIRGRALSVEQRMRWSQVGFIVLLGIMVWALSNDFMRLFGL
jgi:regulator of sigma E protease